MIDRINYIFRKRLPTYNSIEELFGSIANEVSKTRPTQSMAMPHSGASPSVLIKNLRFFDKKTRGIRHITGDVHYMALSTGKHTVLTIHDIKSASQGNIFKVLYVHLFWFWLPALFVNRITVISEFTKEELGKITPFAKHKIRVVSNPVNPTLKPTPYKFNTDNPNILVVGTKANKNLERCFEALKDISCQLTIIGQLTSDQSQRLQALGIDYHNRTNLTFSQVADCYIQADMLCFASTYEGFGMPIIEAQAVGRPVLTANFGAMKEVAQDSACLVNPYEVDAIKAGVLRILSDEAYRSELITKGLKNVERFQSAKIAQEYIEIYQEMLQE